MRLRQGESGGATETESPSNAAGPGPAAAARRALAVFIGKVTCSGVGRVGRRRTSSIPGLVTLAIDPGALAGLVAEIARGTVLVTGSRGMDTTCRMLAHVMRQAGLHPVLDQEGSSQRAGLATTMVARSALTGHLPADTQAVGLFEVGESSLPEVLQHVRRPSALVFTNIFRDHLDRFLGPAFVTAMLEKSLRTLPPTTALVLNADDPRVAYLAADLPNPRLYFGIEDTDMAGSQADPMADVPACPRCGGELGYECIFTAHLGHWACTHCGLARPQTQVGVTKIDLTGPLSARLNVVTPTADTILDVPFPGLDDAYNAVAAVAAATQCQLPDQSISAIDQVTPGHFRMERVPLGRRDICLAAAENAGGYTEVLRAVQRDGLPGQALLGLSDCTGKQSDTSWIWDVDFDGLTGLADAPVVTGNRAADLAVRLKYTGWLGDDGEPDLLVEPDPVQAFRAALTATPPGQPLWVISTTVVLVRIRRWLRQQGYVQETRRDRRGHGQHPSGPARPSGPTRPSGPARPPRQARWAQPGQPAQPGPPVQRAQPPRPTSEAGR